MRIIIQQRSRMLSKLLYREIEKIHENQKWTTLEKIDQLSRLLSTIFVEATKKERLQFTTLFARIAYTAHQFDFDKELQYYIHRFRKAASFWSTVPKVSSDNQNLKNDYDLGLSILCQVVEKVFHSPPTEVLCKYLPEQLAYTFTPKKIKGFLPQQRVVVLEINESKKQLLAKSEAAPEEAIHIQYNIADRNENFNPSIQALQDHFKLPAVVNLLEVEIDQEGIYRPRAFVLEPDHLIDVSAVAECFQPFGAEPLTYLLKKFLPFETTKYLIIGNIANYFLDELLSNPESTFREIFPKVFQLNPLAFVLLDNRIVKEIMQTSQRHFVNLKKIILQDFPKFGVEKAHCYLEPTFYTSDYGLQGRLDIFYQNEKPIIIELKSGKAYRPNIYGISNNHFTQTLLYDLMIKSVFENKTDPTNYILYSGVEGNHLRFAPVVKAQQYEAIQNRNQLVAIERQLAQLGTKESTNNVFTKLKAAYINPQVGFLKRDVIKFEKLYSNMSTLERSYFNAFAGFIAREHQLAKTGIHGLEEVNGQAALWLDNFKTKEERYDVLNHLQIQTQNASDSEPILTFVKSKQTNPLANFRKGDIAILYPFQSSASSSQWAVSSGQSTVSSQQSGLGDAPKTHHSSLIAHNFISPLKNQLFKCTIIKLTKETVSVRLRSKQFNESIFKEIELWNLEHDLLDSSFISMYRSLYQFFLSPSNKRELLLTTAPPQQGVSEIVSVHSELTEEQQEILNKIIASKDYFLLWGPPGTGKTSMMLKHLVNHLLNNTDENILLMAYTNRAVDEICASIEQLGEHIKKHYVRIGSRYSTAPTFQGQLFSEKTKTVKTRKGLRAIIEDHRIFVSTVSSISNKPELLSLKQFNTAIIDEASQILEPTLMGLLPKFSRFVLIGDHKQLPAVVVQDEEVSAVQDEDLKDIGLDNLRNSLFERIYEQCQKNKWNWAYAQLSHQGRMHEEIMDFPNKQFYESTLKILPLEIPHHALQRASLSYQSNAEIQLKNDLIELLSTNRKLFFPTTIDTNSTNHKTNTHEAKLIAQLVKHFREIFLNNNLTFDKQTLGVITPFRAQIATIRHELALESFDESLITIDTVERYQGGARDIIIISLCTNKENQLNAISSFSKDGKVDRKLNVALTRARKHLVILGNPDILKTNEVYRALIEDCYTLV